MSSLEIVVDTSSVRVRKKRKPSFAAKLKKNREVKRLQRNKKISEIGIEQFREKSNALRRKSRDKMRKLHGESYNVELSKYVKNLRLRKQKKTVKVTDIPSPESSSENEDSDEQYAAEEHTGITISVGKKKQRVISYQSGEFDVSYKFTALPNVSNTIPMTMTLVGDHHLTYSAEEDIVFSMNNNKTEGTLDTVITFLRGFTTPHEIMDGYIFSLIGSQNDSSSSVSVVPSTVYQHRVGCIAVHNPRIQDIPQNISSKKMILMPLKISVAGSAPHFYLAVMYRKKRVVHVYNPLNDYTNKKDTDKQVNKMIELIYEPQSDDDFVARPKDLQILYIKCPQQKDIVSCGLYVLYFATSVLAGVTTISRPTKKILEDLRKNVASKLLSTTKIGKEILNLVSE